MKNILTLTLLLILSTGTSFASSIPFNSGTYIGTVSKANDPTGTNPTFEALVKTMLTDTSIFLPADLSFDYFTKVEVSDSSNTGDGNTLSLTYESNKKAGTWTTSSSINLYSVKAGNQYALYWLGLGENLTGNWSTEDLIVGKRNQPGISHISAWTVTSSSSSTPTSGTSAVPEPSTMLLFGMGLLGASYWSRKK